MRTTFTLAATALALAEPAVAQHTPPDSATIARAMAALKADLRNYVVAQEAYFADHVTYAKSAARMPFTPSARVTIVLLTSSADEHSAVAIHGDVPGLVCGIWVGPKAAPPLRDAAREGVPTCRTP